MGTNSARSSPGSQRPSSDSDTNVVDCQLLRKPPGLGSGCDKGSKSSKFLAHHSLCPSALRLKEPEGEKTETQKGQDFSQERGAKRTGWTGAPSWLGWVSCPPRPFTLSFPHAGVWGVGPPALTPPPRCPSEGAGPWCADRGVHSEWVLGAEVCLGHAQLHSCWKVIRLHGNHIMCVSQMCPHMAAYSGDQGHTFWGPQPPPFPLSSQQLDGATSATSPSTLLRPAWNSPSRPCCTCALRQAQLPALGCGHDRDPSPAPTYLALVAGDRQGARNQSNPGDNFRE